MQVHDVQPDDARSGIEPAVYRAKSAGANGILVPNPKCMAKMRRLIPRWRFDLLSAPSAFHPARSSAGPLESPNFGREPEFVH